MNKMDQYDRNSLIYFRRYKDSTFEALYTLLTNVESGFETSLIPSSDNIIGATWWALETQVFQIGAKSVHHVRIGPFVQQLCDFQIPVFTCVM